MTSDRAVRPADVGNCLAESVPLVQRTGERCWDIGLADGAVLLGTVRMGQHWLLCDVPLNERGDRVSAWRMVEWNARLEGATKYALTATDPSLHLRAELVLDDEVDLATRLRETCTGFASALRIFHDQPGAEAAAKSHLAASPEKAGRNGTADLPCLVSETGWAFTARTAGKLAVDLEARHGFYQALLEERADGSVQIATELARWDKPSSMARRALGTLLLMACGLVRLTRAAIEEHDGQAVARFEVVLATPPVAAELDRVFGALSIACREFGPAAAALKDETLARQYLTIRGCIAHSAEEENRHVQDGNTERDLA